MSVNIPDDILKRVLKVVGYPIVTVEDFTQTMSIEDLNNLVLKDAINAYFAIFPKKTLAEYDVGRTFTIPFPDEYTYGVLDYKIVL